MSPETVRWVLALHVVGVIVWVGAMLSTSAVLALHTRAQAADRSTYEQVERSLARWMERGAGLAIVGGLIMAFGVEGLMKQGYMHAKLAGAVGLIAVHGLVRARMAKLGRGAKTGPAGYLVPVILLLAAAVVALAIVKPF